MNSSLDWYQLENRRQTKWMSKWIIWLWNVYLTVWALAFQPGEGEGGGYYGPVGDVSTFFNVVRGRGGPGGGDEVSQNMCDAYFHSGQSWDSTQKFFRRASVAQTALHCFKEFSSDTDMLEFVSGRKPSRCQKQISGAWISNCISQYLYIMIWIGFQLWYMGCMHRNLEGGLDKEMCSHIVKAFQCEITLY